MAAREYDLEIAVIDATLVSIEKVLDLPKLRKNAILFEEAAGVPNLWDDPENAQKVTSKLSRVQSEIKRLVDLRQRVEDLPILIELAQNESDASALADAERELDSVKKAVSELEVQTLLNGEYDDRDALITIRSEAGGVEAADWALSRVQSEIKRLIDLRQRVEDLPILIELAQNESDASALADAERELDSVKKVVSELEVQTLLNGEYDDRDALITIRSEAGGVEAADWAEMLMRMYLRYCERHNFPVSVLETSYAEEAGIKSTTFRITAPYAYGTLSVEQGTHRLVRISPFDSQSRRHTSFAGVEVVPVVDQSDHIDIDEKDIRVDVYRSSGPGGQGVNTTDLYIVPLGLEGKELIQLTQLFESHTWPQELLSLVRMNVLKSKIRQLQWRYCNQSYWNVAGRKSKQ